MTRELDYGEIAARDLPALGDGRYGAVVPLTFGRGRLVIVNGSFVDDGW